MMKIVLVQSELVWGDVPANLGRFDEKIRSAPEGGVILLPEMFVSGCMMVQQSPEIAVAEKQRVARRFPEVCSRMSDWASGKNAVVAGSTVYGEDGRYFNRMIVAFPDGSFRYYDKRHCFRMGGESEHFSPGCRQLVFEFRGVRIAAFICYDLRFPVWSRNTAGYDLAVYAANWPESRREVWKTLLKARAIENQAFVAGVNCVGTDNSGIRYAGDSMVAGARGKVLGCAGEHREETLAVECDVAALHEFRRKFSVLDDRDAFAIG